MFYCDPISWLLNLEHLNIIKGIVHKTVSVPFEFHFIFHPKEVKGILKLSTYQLSSKYLLLCSIQESHTGLEQHDEE